jgi:hypothetical protein
MIGLNGTAGLQGIPPEVNRNSQGVFPNQDDRGPAAPVRMIKSQIVTQTCRQDSNSLDRPCARRFTMEHAMVNLLELHDAVRAELEGGEGGGTTATVAERPGSARGECAAAECWQCRCR